MKRYSFLILLALCSCTKFLTEKPKSSITEDTAYSTSTRVFVNAVASLYNYVGGNDESQGLQGTYRGVYDFNTFTTDEALIPWRGADWYDGGFWGRLHTHTWTPAESALKNTWNYLYKVVVFSNNSLEILEASDKINDSDREKWMAEVRAFRAIFYCYIMDMFGNVPVVTDADLNINEVAQSSRAEVYDFIKKELVSVLDSLPKERSAYFGDYYGRVTYYVAAFALAKLCLNSEVYTGKSDYADCLKYCEALIEEFDLDEVYTYMFDEYNEYSEENIFTIPMDKTIYTAQFRNRIRSLNYYHGSAYGQICENGSCATQDALYVYGIDFDADHPDHTCKNADARIDYNYFIGTMYNADDEPIIMPNGDTLVYYPEAAYQDLSGTEYEQTGGARMKKYTWDPNAGLNGKQPANDIVLFRLGDVLLMHAEAILRGMDNGSDLGGYKKEDAQNDLDRIRARVGSDSVEVSLDNLLDERLMELAWEGWRRNDLVRFGRFDEDTTKNIFPIPADILASNKNLKQNPGY